MGENERVVAKNVTMYPAQWRVVERKAVEIATVVGGRPATSTGLQKIIREYLELKELVASQGGE